MRDYLKLAVAFLHGGMGIPTSFLSSSVGRMRTGCERLSDQMQNGVPPRVGNVQVKMSWGAASWLANEKWRSAGIAR